MPSPVDKPGTEQLALAAAGGDVDALGELFERYSDAVYRRALLALRNHAEAQDVMQETWCRVARSIRTYQPVGGGFVPWLFKISQNIIKDLYRRPLRRREFMTGDMLLIDHASPDDTPEQAALRREAAAAVATALNRLPQRQRRCLILRFWSNLSTADTAAALDITPGAARALQYRAIRALADRLPPGTPPGTMEVAAPARISAGAFLVADAQPQQVKANSGWPGEAGTRCA